jgi:16S rRNA (uracil1498-N3)-methyltransferase
VAEVVAVRAVDRESPLRIVLLQALARGEKMDWIVQKATELGVAAIVPVDSERSEVRLDAARADRRVAHWRSVAASACEQSGRARLPSLVAPVLLTQAGAACVPGGLRLMLDPDAAQAIRTLPDTGEQDIAIAIGPEGGWSPRDLRGLAAVGFAGVRLGPRILRTETAGLAAIAALQSRFGDL